MRLGWAMTRRCDALDVAAVWPSCAQISGVAIPDIARETAEQLDPSAEEANEHGIW